MLVASARFISRWRMHAVSACKFSAVGSVQFSSVVRCGCSREPICAPHPVVTLNLSSTASPSMSECSQSVFAVSRSLWFSSDQNAGSQCLLCLARSGSVQVRMLTVSIWCLARSGSVQVRMLTVSIWCLARSGSVQVRLLTVSIWCLARFGSVQVRMQAVNFRCVSLALAQFRSDCSQSVFAVSRSLWFSSGQNAGSQYLLSALTLAQCRSECTQYLLCLARSGSVQVRMQAVSICCLARSGSLQVGMLTVSICCVSLALAQFRSAQLQVTLCKVIFTKRSHLTLARSA